MNLPKKIKLETVQNQQDFLKLQIDLSCHNLKIIMFRKDRKNPGYASARIVSGKIKEII